MIVLDVTDLVVIAGQVLGTGTSAALDQLDVAAARAALVEADGRNARIGGDPDRAAEAGIKLVHALLRYQPFPEQGYGIAVAAGLQFLSLNGWRAELDSPETAAVVVEALACGQLSPAAVAAWLAPRLTVDRSLRPHAGRAHSFQSMRLSSAARQAAALLALKRSSSAPIPAPFHRPATPPKPALVVYPQVLLFVQAGGWALLVLASIFAMAPMGDTEGNLILAGMGVGAGLTVAKVLLALRLNVDRSRRLWRTVIATELAMTCFGLLWLLIPTPLAQVPGLIGAVLSLAAVLCMTRPRARECFHGPDAAPGNPDPGALSGRASFRRLALAGHRAAVA